MAFTFKLVGTAWLTGAFIGAAVAENRTIDGTGNNLQEPQWGASNSPFSRLAPSDYEDGIAEPRRSSMPNARFVSNTVCVSHSRRGNGYGLSDYVWQWGQFIDHDITLSSASSDEPFFIDVEAGDPLAPRIPMMRTQSDPLTGQTAESPREQVNSITSYIDGSMVYGSDDARAAGLRTHSGGRLRTLHANGSQLLPFNLAEFPNANDLGAPPQTLFLAGDVRSNEQLGLIAMHTVFLREHNRLAEELAAANPNWTDEEIYQRARKIVGALVQVITYEEFLPALLGSWAPELETFTYDPNLQPAISNEFATAIYRIGHTMVPDQLLLRNADGSPSQIGSIPVANAFFDPGAIIADPGMIDQLVKGLSMQSQESVDPRLVDSFRNQLFGSPGAGGLDLAALNIQRGRDHGLASYNEVRVAVGLDAKNSIDDISTDSTTRANLKAAYTTIDHIDLWIGALSEDHLPGAAVGELAATVMAQQFRQLAEGDRFFFMFDPELDDIRQELMATRLSDVLRRNTEVASLQANVFVVPEQDQRETEFALNSETGDITLSMVAVPGQIYSLQRSAELAEWVTIASDLKGDGKISATDTGALNTSRRLYYRFIEQ